MILVHVIAQGAGSLVPADIVGALRLDLLAKLILAVLFGGAIGLERQVSGKPAGLRTNILICLGSALLTDLSLHIGLVEGDLRVGDPGRLAAQIVSGIGFIGAGTIMQARGSVIGLTTAATIWVVAAIGMTVGAGHYFEAAGATVLVGVVLGGLGSVEHRLLRARRVVAGTIRARPDTPWEELDQILASAGIRVTAKEIYDHPDDRTFELKMVGPARQYDVVTAVLMRRSDVLSVQLD